MSKNEVLYQILLYSPFLNVTVESADVEFSIVLFYAYHHDDVGNDIPK